MQPTVAIGSIEHERRRGASRWLRDGLLTGGPHMPRTALNFIAPVVRQCIDECVRCHEVCLSTIPYCLEQGSEHAEEAHIVLLQDCAEICRTNADFMLRGSDEHERVCAACAAICRHCADDCDRLSDDEVMRACAEACRRCAEFCDRMATAAV
jgi:hypothetical protein